MHQLNVSTVEPLGKCVQTQCLAVKALGICKKKSCEYEVKSCENENQMGEGVGGWGIALRTSCISQNKCVCHVSYNLVIFDYRISKLFACSRCVICVSCSVHVILTYYVRKGSRAFFYLFNSRFSSHLSPLFQSESQCEAFHMQISFIQM